jgi:uncharacterized protein (DUF779 family)
METKIARLSATENALEVIQKLADQYGPLMFYQAGDVVKEHNRSVLKKEAFSRMNDAMIGTISGYEFWIDRTFLNTGNIPILPLM